ncbi:MAG: ABC transporter ATP-binding protein YtrE [Microgenomates bacterium OLB22]|nr:MAG: ABC transporter ATP-binding protein YtrE [Microgenomates bacterium OLB22]
MTIRENIMLPGRYDDSKPESYYHQRAQELMERFGLAHRAESYPNRISGGEQQRTAISRALIMDPEVILADEPTGNLDTKSGDVVLEILDNLNKKDKKTIVVVTHEQEVARRAFRSVTIRDGVMTIGKSKGYAKKKATH